MLILAWIFSIGVMQDLAPCTGVIGVAWDQRGVIKHVFENSPADKAGLEKYDFIINRKSTKGTVGTSVSIKYIDASDNKKIKKVKINRMCKRDLYGSW